MGGNGGDIVLKILHIGEYMIVDVLQNIAGAGVGQHKIGFVDVSEPVTLAGNRGSGQTKLAENMGVLGIHRHVLPTFSFQYTPFFFVRKEENKKRAIFYRPYL